MSQHGRSRRSPWAVFALAAALFATILCAASCAPRRSRPEFLSANEVDRQAEAAHRHIASIRGQRPDKPIRVVMLSNAAFRDMEIRNARNQCRAAAARPDKVQKGLATWQPPEDCDRVTVPFPRIGKSSLAGFFNPEERTVYLRDIFEVAQSLRLEDSDMDLFGEQQWILGHELYHGIQDDRFQEARGKEFSEPDEEQARDALWEGDANLVGLIVEAMQLRYDWKFRMEKMHFQAIHEPHLSNSYVIGYSPWYPEPRNLRRTFEFGSYAAGLAFVSELWTEGGFAYIDRAYRHLPASTEQVLHTEKYLAGEMPLPVAAPVLPEGWQSRVSHRLGELTTRALLSTCLEWKPACNASTGWGGDRLTLSADGAGHTAWIWTTVWDGEAQAERFFMTAQKHGGCLGQALSILREHHAFTSDGAAARPAGDVPRPFVRRDGKKTALVFGLPDEAAEAIAKAFFLAPIAEPPANPPPPIK